MIKGTIVMNPDQHLRTQALDPKKSFIIRAPAGSGKTSLLIERFLHLLNGHVNHPSEIFALTFTLKSCEEMKERILSALNSPSPLTDSILAIDKQLNWNLKDNPHLLNIMTIDALANQIHQTSNSDLAHAHISPNASRLYQEACEYFLYETSHQDSIHQLIRGLEYDSQKLITLLITLLEKREQWIPYLSNPDDIILILSQHIHSIQDDLLARCIQCIPKSKLTTWSSLLTTLVTQTSRHDVSVEQLLHDQNFEAWAALANWLLTAKGTFKKRLTKNEGFLPEHKALKDVAKEWITLSQECQLEQPLKSLQAAPSNAELQDCEQFYQALSKVLPELCAHLHLTMQKYQSIDFIEMNLRSTLILSEHNHESYQLDNRIQHMLIDEYQDTSNTHANLISHIISVWDKQKTLFIVGDHMQSIYRFRQADVRLYLKAFEQGLEKFPLTPITLTSNFRSSACIVEFNNHIFDNLFPHVIDYNSAAVPFSLAHPQKHDPGTLNIHQYEDENLGNVIASWIKKAPLTGSIAILARTRSQLSEISDAFVRLKIEYQGIELSPLLGQPIIRDLITLDQSLNNLSNRTAWLALLRSPCIGLVWKDINSISQVNSECIFNDLLECDCLSTDGKSRVNFLLNTLQPLLAIPSQYNRYELLLEASASLQLERMYPRSQQAFASKFFEVCQQLHDQQAWGDLEHSLANTWGSFEIDTNLHLMTVHKSKGLEFDTVLITHLNKATQKDSTPLMFWDDYHTDKGLLPLIFPGHIGHQNAEFMKTLSKTKLKAENKRLLYVALTRSKHNLHLWMHQDTSSESNTWAAWIKNALTTFPQEKIHDHYHPTLEIGTKHPSDPQLMTVRRKNIPPTESVEIPEQEHEELPSRSGQFFGTLVHEVFQFTKFSPNKATAELLTENIHQRISQLNLTEADTGKWNQLRQSLVNDPFLPWLFESENCMVEIPLTYATEQGFKNIRIDRLIIDNDNAWIIDIKTKNIKNSSNLADITYQQYKDQLEHYANIIQSLNTPYKNIYCTIYYPMIAQCVVWKAHSENPQILPPKMLQSTSLA